MLQLFLSITEQFNCFSSASIQYTQSLQQAQVVLEPNLTAGRDFPNEALFELFVNTNNNSFKYIKTILASIRSK